MSFPAQLGLECKMGCAGSKREEDNVTIRRSGSDARRLSKEADTDAAPFRCSVNAARHCCRSAPAPPAAVTASMHLLRHRYVSKKAMRVWAPDQQAGCGMKHHQISEECGLSWWKAGGRVGAAE